MRKAAPEGSIENACPAQTVPLLTLTIGSVLTITVDTAAELIHPDTLLPVTEYILVETGLTIDEPPLMVKLVAPVGVKVNEPPAQMEPLFTETIGSAITDALAMAGAEIHPCAFIPFTVYELFTVGITVLEPLE
jgi:hypothetical protein